MRGATTSALFFLWQIAISIHAPVRGATIRVIVRFLLFIIISIHAPVRGATTAKINELQEQNISIHAPVRGATNLSLRLESPDRFQFTLPCGERPDHEHYKPLERDFNSRSRAGSDYESPGPYAAIWISIHAPVRGATAAPRKCRLQIRFQFTLPCGERHANCP